MKSPFCLSLTYHEVQGRNWQHAVFAQKAVRAQALACSWSRKHSIWRQVSALLLAFCESVRGSVLSGSQLASHPERLLTSGIKQPLISCAFFITHHRKSDNFPDW